MGTVEAHCLGRRGRKESMKISSVSFRTRAVRAGPAGRALAALALVQALFLAAGAHAQEVCKPEFRVGAHVWYAAEALPRVARTSDSACKAVGGAGATVRFTMRGSQEIIFCDRALPIPD